MVNKSSNQKGFTLIELMISTSLLMLIMYSGYFAYNLYSSSWQKKSNAFWQETNFGLKLTSLYRVFDGLDSYIVKNKTGLASIYFKGDVNSLTFISNAPIYSSDSAIVMLEIVEQGNKQQLHYFESSLSGRPLFEQSDEREWDFSVILISDVEQMSFNYFGWQSIEAVSRYEDLWLEPERGVKPEEASWYENHLMETTRMLPSTILLRFTDRAGSETLLPFFPPQHSHHVLYRFMRTDT